MSACLTVEATMLARVYGCKAEVSGDLEFAGAYKTEVVTWKWYTHCVTL